MLFTSVNKKYEECALKSQKPTRAEILTKMRMKAVHFRNLSALSNDEKEMLLKKVNYENISSIDQLLYFLSNDFATILCYDFVPVVAENLLLTTVT